MVYCGRPSTQCRRCRERNLKCNKKTPSCGQCIRAHLTCPGYPNPSQIIIRDETKSVILKASSHPSTKSPSSNTSTSTSTTPASTSLQKPIEEDPIIHIPKDILPPLEYRAKYLFMTHHIHSAPTSFRYMRYFKPSEITTSYFLFCTKATCLAYMALQLSSPEILDEARRKYGRGLVLLNEALRDKESAMRNETLASVLLLNYFERLSEGVVKFMKEGREEGEEEGEKEREKDARMKHLEGAIALVKLREKNQFMDPVGEDMFRHLEAVIEESDCPLSKGAKQGLEFILKKREHCLVAKDGGLDDQVPLQICGG